MSSLSAATQDRKARLAQLKSLKRKQPDEDTEETATETPSKDEPSSKDEITSKDESTEAHPASETTKYLSGRNYDPTTRGPRLGFEASPASTVQTVEARAQTLAKTTAAQAAALEAANEPLDLFKLQPKKPNWDLKRDLDLKLEVLNVRTENAIARLVRERIREQKEKAKARGKKGDGEGEEVGIEGATLVEATKEREREDEEEVRREREADEAYLDGG
ncbi:hypothetical protein MBLNU457_g0380t1 [Dothideomycetes sp. NU457]